MNHDPTLFRYAAAARQQDLLADAARDRRAVGLPHVRLPLPNLRTLLRRPVRPAAARPGASA